MSIEKRKKKTQILESIDNPICCTLEELSRRFIQKVSSGTYPKQVERKKKKRKKKIGN